MATVQIDISLIDKADVRAIGATFTEAVKRFYEDPKNLKAFEEWKKNRK